MKEHRGVRNLDDALTCLSGVKMLILGKQLKTRVRAAKWLGTHHENQRLESTEGAKLTESV